MKRLETGAALLLFALTAALYAAGAARADPGISVARSDLEVLRHWKESGRIEDLAGDPSHLGKPGYLIYLRAMLPHEGTDAGEVRRFLAVNAIAVLCGLGAAALALTRRSGPRAAILFLVFGLLYLPAWDSADYVGSEPLAIGASLLILRGTARNTAGRAWPRDPPASRARGSSSCGRTSAGSSSPPDSSRSPAIGRRGRRLNRPSLRFRRRLGPAIPRGEGHRAPDESAAIRRLQGLALGHG